MAEGLAKITGRGVPECHDVGRCDGKERSIDGEGSVHRRQAVVLADGSALPRVRLELPPRPDLENTVGARRDKYGVGHVRAKGRHFSPMGGLNARRLHEALAGAATRGPYLQSCVERENVVIPALYGGHVLSTLRPGTGARQARGGEDEQTVLPVPPTGIG